MRPGYLQGRRKSITDATSKTVEYRYDPAGNLNRVQYPNGNKSYFDYYGDSLLKSISYKNEDTSYSFEYNPVHALTGVRMHDAGSTMQDSQWLFGYDEGNRLTTTTESINAMLGDFSIFRAHDKASNLTEIKAGADSTTYFGYNSRYDLTGIDLPGGETTEVSFGYDRARKRTAIIEPGVKSSIDYDEASRIKGWTNETSAGTQRFAYSHDGNGNIVDVTENAGETSRTARYAYDVLNRLTGWYNPLIDTTTTYSYDKVGNLLEVKEGEAVDKSFAYNAANQISSAGYAYDANGNMTEDPAKRYVYDFENRLKTVVNKDTSQTLASYTYDFMGRRISAATSDTTTYFHYDGWNVVAESDSSGAITANYYYDTGGQIQAMKRDGNMFYYQFNAHGDVVSLTDVSGTIVNSYSYDPWGNPLATSETVSNPYRYAGYRWDNETGLYYLRARYYAAGMGRFLTRDAIEDYDLNLYRYTGNNPVNMIDPSGLTWESNLKFFRDWVLGRGKSERHYGPNDIETQEMRESIGVMNLRNRLKAKGGRSFEDGEYDTFRAYWDTTINPLTRDWSSTAAQVGGFGGARIINNGNGTATFTIRNVAGTHSFFLHLVPDRASSTGPMRSITQTFTWTESSGR